MKTDTRKFDVKEYDGLCCPEKGYKTETVFAVVRASHNARYVFTDGRTLTVGHKTRYATFPRPDALQNAVNEAEQEMREKFPLTRNLYTSYNKRAVASTFTLQTA